MKNKTKELIEKIYDLSVKLYYEVADDRMLKCGHPGVMGPSGNDENFSIEWGELVGAIKTLEQVGDKIITPKTIAIISFDVEDFETLHGRFETAIEQDYEKDQETLTTRDFGGKSDYEVVKISSYDEGRPYSKYTSWCVLGVNKNHVDYEKNAKLIESAPELYSIVKEIYKITEGPFDDPVIQEDLYDRMNEIIKRLS